MNSKPSFFRIFAEAQLIEELRFARDSPLEGAGFEPSVPRSRTARSLIFPEKESAPKG
jgi:hypothetical protein